MGKSDKYQITFKSDLLNADLTDKRIVIDGLTKALGLSKAKKHSHPRLRPGDGENKIIAELERQFQGQLWKRKELNVKVLKYIADHKLLGKDISDREMNRFKEYLSKLFELPMANITNLVMRSFLVGAMVELGEKPVAIDLAALPTSVREAIKQGKLTYEQVRYIGMLQKLAAEDVAGISEAAQHRIRRMLIEAVMNGTGHKQFAQMLFGEFDEEGMLNRDMDRIAITEMNRGANAGFISGIRAGEYVVGISHRDACQWCLDNIQGKVLRVVDNPPEDYANLNPESPKYKQIAKIWDTCIWPTKSNVGRSTSPRKADKSAREHHELASPATLCHVSGRCRWVRFMSDFMYIDDKNEVKYVESEAEDAKRLEWLKNNPEIVG
jgi:hypothetical protein